MESYYKSGNNTFMRSHKSPDTNEWQRSYE